HLLDHDAGELARILGGLEGLVGAADHPGRLDARPVRLEGRVEVGAVADARDREADARAPDAAPVDVAWPLGDVDALDRVRARAEGDGLLALEHRTVVAPGRRIGRAGGSSKSKD